MEPTIEVLKVSLGKKGKVLAYMNARVTFQGEHGITLSSLKLIDGAKGKFVDTPARKYKDQGYVPYYFLNKPMKDTLTTACLDAFEKAKAGKGSAVASAH